MTSRQNAYYWQLWNKACAVNGWPIGDTERRHAIHREALGYDMSHKHFTEADFDRVINTLKLQANPLDLNQVIESDHPEHGDRRRLLWRIRDAAPEPYIRKISSDRFGTSDYESLDNQQLEQLRNTVVNRARSAKKQGRQLALSL